MKELEIYFRDLVSETQSSALNLYGIKSPEDANWDNFPIFTLEVSNPDGRCDCDVPVQ